MGWMMRGLVALGLALALAGCQTGGGAAPDIAPPSAIQGPAVEVTALAPIEEVEAADLPPPKADPVPAAAKPKSASQTACEKRGGSFVALGRSGAMTCQTPTRDGGKQCRRASDCDGVCLARSGTCAPVKPLLGCQSVLQNDGRRVELCID